MEQLFLSKNLKRILLLRCPRIQRNAAYCRGIEEVLQAKRCSIHLPTRPYTHFSGNVNIQDCTVIHGDENVVIEDNVSLGHSCIIHGATIKKNALIGMGAVVMDDAVVGENSIVAAGALIPHGKIIPPNSLVMGSPGKVKRELAPEEVEGNLANAAVYIAIAHKNKKGI